MGFNSNLPVLVPALIALIVVSVAAGLSLAWIRQSQARVLIRRVWIVAAIVIVGGAGIFWMSTALVEGPPRATIDHSLQDRQQDELRQRLEKGGH